MISLSNIVKSVAVVDDRPARRKTVAEQFEIMLDQTPVIKRQVFHYRENPYADAMLVLPDKQGYLDELNRVKVEIAQAKAELRSLGRRLEEERESGAAPVTKKAVQPERSDYLAAEKEEAERLLREANETAEKILRESRAKGEELAMQAQNGGYLAGFEQGFAQAMQEFKAENEPKITELQHLLARLSEYGAELAERSEQDIVTLAMAIAKKIVGQELKTDQRAVAAMLYRVLDENRREQTVRVTVSPELMPADAKISAEIRKMIAQTAPNAMIYIDEEASEGTCVVESDKGITDLSIETQLKNINSLLAEE